MAKYSVTHSCGHEVPHQLFGPNSDRDRKIEWLESVPCLDCKRKQDEEQRNTQNREAAEANAAIGAPPLTGSEKQVAWAETIRRQTLVSFSDAHDRVKSFPEPDLLVEYAIKGTINWLFEQTEAKWWIETIGTLKSTSGLAPLFSLLNGKLPRASEAEILRHVMMESPYCTEEVATKLRFGEEFRARVAARAAVVAKEEMRKQLEASKPICPGFIFAGAATGATWNGKIYSGRRIYVGGKEVFMTSEQEIEIKNYLTAKAAWIAAKEKAGL